MRVDVHRLRKRLAAYYSRQGAAQKLKIVIPPGSYEPDFQMCVSPPVTSPSQTYSSALEIASPVQAATAPATPEAQRETFPVTIRQRSVLGATAALSVLVIAMIWLRPWPRPTDVDRFWKPVLDSSNTVLLCMGQRQFLGSSPEPGQVVRADLPAASSEPVTLFQLYYMGSQNLSLPDVSTIASLTGLLQAKGKTFRVRGQLSTDFSDLREGPVVLVGAFDNDWTMRLMGPMRFSFARDHDTFWIRDSRNPSRRDRAVNYRTPYLNLTEDYALISRTLDPTTERMAVVIGGLTGYGTIAAGEFLTTPEYLRELARGAPQGWEHRNIQVVLATRVIHGNSGPPRIIERHFW